MVFRIPKDTEITTDILAKFIGLHRQQVSERFEKLRNAYIGDHEILHMQKKPAYKPDNRIVVNFPKYMVDTMNGFFLGNPVKIVAEDGGVADFVEYIDRYNDQDDNNSELAKICDIYGRGYEMYYTDEESELCITYLTPIDAFMIYDDSILERPLYFVRRYTDWEGTEYGSISNSYGVRRFKVTGGLKWTEPEWEQHRFDGVPATEYVENEERLGIFEPVMSCVNQYNKVLSEKANDIDYFADAYLKVLGAKVDGEDIRFIRDNRIINFEDDDGANKITVEFMGKPESDVAQENLLNRLERRIFETGMVANISDENFGTSSGIALKYKILAMINLAKTKVRKFQSGMARRYKLLFSHPLSKVPADSWVQLSYHFSQNIPANMLEEAEIASKLAGQVSQKTQLKVLSVVDDVQAEMAEMDAENAAIQESAVERAMFMAANENAE